MREERRKKERVSEENKGKCGWKESKKVVTGEGERENCSESVMSGLGGEKEEEQRKKWRRRTDGGKDV